MIHKDKLGLDGLGGESVKGNGAADDLVRRLRYDDGVSTPTMGDLAEAAALIERIEELEALSVTHIMLDIVPGEDGMGEEVYVAEALSTITTGNAVQQIEARALREAAAELKKIEVHHDSFAYKLLRKLAEQKEKDGSRADA